MKKMILVLLCMVLLLTAGCAKQESVAAAEETTEVTTQPTITPTETTAPPTEPLPQTEEATILADHVPAVLSILSRGDTVDVVKEYDEESYVVKTEMGYGLVEKHLLATAEEEPYEAWTGYSRRNKNVYDNHHLTGTPIQTLKTNTQVEVLEEYGDCCVVKIEDVIGYMKLEDVSKTRVSSGGGGGSSDGGSSGGGGGQDGGDISLQFQGKLVFLSAIAQEGSVTGQATVKVDGTEVVLGFFDREDIAQIVVESGFAEDWEGYATILLDDLYAHVPENLLQRKDAEPFAAWDGFAKSKAAIHDNFYLQGEGERLNTNTPIHVIADLGNCYLVSTEDGFGYMEKEMVSEKKVSQGGGGGGSSGGGGGGGQEWSDPVL